VYRYVRLAWNKSNEDAKDLTQAFFLWLMEGEALGKYRSDRGSFRGYLKVLLRGFSAHHEEALRCLKRGGGVRFLSFDEDREALVVSSGPDPERAFDAVWASDMARRAIERVRAKLAEEGRDKAMRTYDEYVLSPSEEAPTYTSVGERLGLKEDQVRHLLSDVREEIRGEIRKELLESVRSEEELREEMNAIFGR